MTARLCPNCEAPIPVTMAFCRPCWRRLPRSHQLGITGAWQSLLACNRAGDLNGLIEVVKFHQLAINDATAWLRRTP